MASEWGRKETAVWPPYMPVYTYCAVGIALLCTLLFVWQDYRFWQTPLQRSYATEYIRSMFGAQFNQHGKYRLVTLGSEQGAFRLAQPEDLIPGTTLLPDGRSVPVMLSEGARKQGYSFFFRAPEKSYKDASLYAWFRVAIFDGNGMLRLYRTSLLESLFCLVMGLCYSIPHDFARMRELKYGRRLKGPEMLSAVGFNRAVKGDGIGIVTTDKARGIPWPRRERPNETVRIPLDKEAQHIEIIGDTGTGKSTIIRQMLQQIRRRGESAIVYDPACEFVKQFYDPAKDIILNPLDARCPYWGPSEELRTKAEAKTIAASLYQPTSDKKGEFFSETPQKIFAHLLTFGPTPQQLVEWMSNPSEIDERVKGTEIASIIEPGAQQQRAGVLASLGLIADSLRFLPTKEQAKEKTWSATQWAEKREGWIFITSRATEREALRPLHSLWIDLLVLRLLNAPTEDQRPVWFVLDELASLQRLPQLHTAITESRKSANPLILGFQGKAQLEHIYGHLAEVMLSQPYTKIFLRTTEPNAAKWVSEAIGDVEIERTRETHVHGNRHGKSFTIDRQTEPLVMKSEISGLADKHAFLKMGNHVARFAFTFCDMPAVATGFEPRNVAEDELDFDPLTLKKKPKSQPAQAVIPSATAIVQEPETPLTAANKAATEKKPNKQANFPAAAAGQEPATVVAEPAASPAPEAQASPEPVAIEELKSADVTEHPSSDRREGVESPSSEPEVQQSTPDAVPVVEAPVPEATPQESTPKPEIIPAAVMFPVAATSTVAKM